MGDEDTYQLVTDMLQISRKWESYIFENVSEKCLDSNLKSAKGTWKARGRIRIELAAICFQQQEIRKLDM